MDAIRKDRYRVRKEPNTLQPLKNNGGKGGGFLHKIPLKDKGPGGPYIATNNLSIYSINFIIQKQPI